MLAAAKTIPKKYERPELEIRAAQNDSAFTAHNPYSKGLYLCRYQNRNQKSRPGHYVCRSQAGKTFTNPSPASTSLQDGIVMGKSENNIVPFPRSVEKKKPANRFETAFLSKSKPDGSPLTIQVNGQLAMDIRSDALAVGKDPKAYAAEGIANWYAMEGGLTG